MLDAVTSALGTVIGWVGTVISNLTDATTGHLNALLPLFAIGLAVSVLMVSMKIIRKITWGA